SQTTHRDKATTAKEPLMDNDGCGDASSEIGQEEEVETVIEVSSSIGDHEEGKVRSKLAVAVVILKTATIKD
ncbi:hypothetical protein BGX27_004289, partial [Mortierella sp. AM989]